MNRANVRNNPVWNDREYKGYRFVFQLLQKNDNLKENPVMPFRNLTRSEGLAIAQNLTHLILRINKAEEVIARF